MDKDLRKLLADLKSQDFVIEGGGRSHYKAFPPDKSKPMVVIDCTPSDHRAWKNTIARLRRSGADL